MAFSHRSQLSQGDSHWEMGKPPAVGQGVRVTHPHRESPETKANLPNSGWEVQDELRREEPPVQFISHTYFWVGPAQAADIIGECHLSGIKAGTSRGSG